MLLVIVKKSSAMHDVIEKVCVQKMLITSFWFPCDQQITTLSLARNIKAVRFTSDGQKVHLDILSKETYNNCIMLYGR